MLFSTILFYGKTVTTEWTSFRRCWTKDVLVKNLEIFLFGATVLELPVPVCQRVWSSLLRTWRKPDSIVVPLPLLSKGCRALLYIRSALETCSTAPRVRNYRFFVALLKRVCATLTSSRPYQTSLRNSQKELRPRVDLAKDVHGVQETFNWYVQLGLFFTFLSIEFPSLHEDLSENLSALPKDLKFEECLLCSKLGDYHLELIEHVGLLCCVRVSIWLVVSGEMITYKLSILSTVYTSFVMLTAEGLLFGQHNNMRISRETISLSKMRVGYPSWELRVFEFPLGVDVIVIELFMRSKLSECFHTFMF